MVRTPRKTHQFGVRAKANGLGIRIMCRATDVTSGPGTTTLPYFTSVSLTPSKENHTVSYAKRVLGGGALYSAV